MATLKDAVVVIMGASSGVGKATALTMAAQGARLVLGARREWLLRDLAEECRCLGGLAIPVRCDVTDPDDVMRLAEAAQRRFGTLDVWVSVAGTGAVGTFTETPLPAHRRVIETNLFGPLHGAHAALPYFLERGRGVLINVNSLGAFFPAPYATAYSASKVGLLGLMDALRAELVGWRHIHVCDVFPSFLDTPGMAHGANYTGRELKPPPGVYDPQKVADTICRLALYPKPHTMVGLSAWGARLAHAVAPGLSGAAMMLFTKAYLSRARSARLTDGNLYAPVARGTGVYGGWRYDRRKIGAAAGAAALGALTAWGLMGSRRRRPAKSGVAQPTTLPHRS